MRKVGIVKYSHLVYFSQPAADRVIYRAICQGRIRNIVEVGIGNGLRAERMIQLISQCNEGESIRYTGIDLFEARPETAPAISLKDVYKRMRQFNARIQLVPGTPFAGLARTANDLVGTDLLILDVHDCPEQMESAWTFVPRMLHPESQVFLADGSDASDTAQFRLVSASEIERQVAAAGRNGRRAA